MTTQSAPLLSMQYSVKVQFSYKFLIGRMKKPVVVILNWSGVEY